MNQLQNSTKIQFSLRSPSNNAFWDLRLEQGLIPSMNSTCDSCETGQSHGNP
jgi:hypothetical protein